MTRRWFFACWFGALICCIPISLVSQINSAAMVGAVTDPQGAAMPGVSITVRSLGTNAVYSTVSDSAGSFLVPVLPVGAYTVRAEMRGFSTWRLPRVTLAAGDRLRVDIRLKVGETKQTVEVVGTTSPALSTDTSDLGTLVNHEVVENMPLNDRNFAVLAQLSAGASNSPGTPTGLPSGTRPDDRRSTSMIEVNGQEAIENNFLIDGMDDNERFIGTLLVKPSIDALEEVKVDTSNYSAALSRSAGAVIDMVTKSGTNQFHGSVYEFLRNTALDANNFFSNAAGLPTSPFHQNQFGGSLGGPIKKGSTWFFGDYEGFRESQGQTFVNTVPTAQEHNGDFTGITPIFSPLTTQQNPANPSQYSRVRFPNDQIPPDMLDHVALNLIALYPLPNAPGLANNFTSQESYTQTADAFDVKIDHDLSSKDRFSTRYSFNNTDTSTPAALPPVNGITPTGNVSAFPGKSLERAQQAALSDVHTFTPTLVGQFGAAYSRMAILSLPINYGTDAATKLGIPGANVDLFTSALTGIAIAGYAQLGDAPYIPLQTIDNEWEFKGGLNYIRSTHNIQAGASLDRREFTPFQSPAPVGSFSFNGNFTNDPSGVVPHSGNALASFLLGYPASTSRSLYLIHPGLRDTEVSWYVQDNWRATHRLTLNLGLRWDLYPPVSEVFNRISNPDLTRGGMLIPGANGVSSTAGVPTDWDNFGPRFGFAFSLTPKTVLRGAYGIFYADQPTGSNFALRNPPFVSLYGITATPLFPINTIDQGFPPPVATSPSNPVGTLNGVSTDLVTPSVQQYNLTLQREVAGTVFGLAYVGTLLRNGILNGPNVNQPLPGPGPVIGPRDPYYSLFPNVSGIDLASSGGTSNYHALQLTAEHRFNSGFTLVTNYVWSHAIDDFQRQGGGAVDQGPWPQLTGNLALERGNSELDIPQLWHLMVSYQFPFGKNLSHLSGFLARGWQVNAIATAQSGLPFSVFNNSPLANTGGGDRPNRLANGLLPSPTIRDWFNTAAFVPQPLYTIGNAGRNILYGPSFKDLDFSVFKNFSVGERANVEFRAEFFNLTNTPNFGLPNSALGSPGVGSISSTVGNPRLIQFALKLLF